MPRLFYHVMQDNVGNLLFGVSGTMRIAGTGTLATIYGDEAMTVILPNPMTNHPSFGSFKCFLNVGDYDFYMAKSGYTFETLTGVQGYGSMAEQNAGAVAITGGSAALGGLDVTGVARIVDKLTLGTTPFGFATKQEVLYDKSTQWGVAFLPGADAGAFGAAAFLNAGGSTVGSIISTASATAYNTSSDGRLKDHVEPLAGALDTIRALRPVSFRWKADGSLGHGLIAQEVQQIVPDVVSQTETLGIDYSKLVPWLVSAVKELTQQVEMLTAQLAAAHA